MKQLIKVITLGTALALGMSTALTYATTPATETTSQYVSSSNVTAKVKAALLQTPGLSSTDINVKTYKGRVLLSGYVNSKAESQLAQQTAAGVAGVTKVENHLVVKDQ
jgi:osmotically-inducible protein OsmY